MTLFAHDCDQCMPLGDYDGHDLYYCDQGRRPTVIARFGDDGPDYISGLEFVGINLELTEAYRRAVIKGHIK